VSTLRLHFLGTLDIHCDDQPLPKPPTLKSQSLLAYLILHRHRPQPRDRLIGLFWGDRPERKARHSLSTALWHIRHCLTHQGCILSDSHTVQFDPQSDLWLDVEEFQVLSSSVSGYPTLKPETERLQRAVALYRGDFLDGFYDDWIINERYRLEALFVEALVRLMVGHETGGEHQAALATALRLLGHDPLREDAHRLAMRAYCQLGRRNAAIEQYHHCREVVLEELGAEPMIETNELYQAILEGCCEVGRVPSAPITVIEPFAPPGRNPLDVVAPSRMVGREQELTFLHDCWQKAQPGHGGLVLISGEAGVGKTRLMEEFANCLRWQGVRVLWGCCYEFERALPYQPLADALRTVLSTLTPPELESFPAWTMAEVTHLVPEILQRRPGLESSAAPGVNEERARLFEGVARFVAELSAHRALLIVLEDLQWASESTLELLHYLARHLADHPVLMVGTLRPEALGLQHPLLAIRRRLAREGLAKPLRLSRLSPEAVEAIVVEMSGAGEAVGPLAERLYQETEGNPFYLMEIVKTLFETGMVYLEEGAWQGNFARISEGEIPLPASLSEAIQSRVSRLNDATQEALRLAAVLGREFDFGLLNAVWGRGREATLETLDELLRHRLIDEGTGIIGCDYAFTHHKIQEAIYAGMPRRRQQHAHARVGAAMESLYGPEAEVVAGELAFHFEHAQQLDKTLTQKTITYRLQAGERAVRLFANEEAIAHFTRALELLKTLPDSPERAQQELMLQVGLAVPLQAVKGYGDPELGRIYDRARELCQQVGETPQLFPVLAQLITFYGVRGELHASRGLAEQLLRLAERTADPLPVALAHLMLGLPTLYLGALAEARAHLEHVIAFYDPQQHHGLVYLYGQDPGIASLNYASWALWSLGYPEQALKRAGESLALAQELAVPLNLVYAQTVAGSCYAFCYDWQKAQELAEACIHLSTEHGFPYWLAGGILLRGWALAGQGQTEEGVAQIRQGLTMTRATGSRLTNSIHLAILAETYGRMGQIEEGLTVLGEAMTMAHRGGEYFYEAEIHRVKGELLLVQGEADAEVEVCFRQAIEVARRQRAKSLELRATVSLCRLWQKQGKREEARQLLAAIYGWFTEGFDTPDLKEAKALLEAL
jgi:DNA-binding SARP family transcriptional activator/predicted ATPase